MWCNPFGRAAAGVVGTLMIIGCATALQKKPTETELPDTSPPLVPIDTSHLAEGHIDFSRYDTPAACERAVYHIRARIWRHGERDTLRYSPESDTFPTAAIEAGRLCAAKFSVEQVPPEQLFYLARLALILGEDEQAKHVVLRRILLTPDTAAQANIAFESVEMYLQARPARVAAAESLTVLIDALGEPARIARLRSHHALLTYYATLFDIPAMQREADSVLSVGKTLNEADLETWGALVPAAYLYRAVIIAFQQTPNDALAEIQEGMNALAKVRGGQLRGALVWGRQSVMQQARLYGTPAQPLVGHYWYNAGDSTTRPTPGKLSLLVQASQNCGEYCYALYAICRRLHQQYADAGLEITLVARTVGFSQNSGVQTPTEEVETIRKYFIDDQQLPITLVVQETQFTTNPDGRRVHLPSQYDEAYKSAPAVLVDRQGIVRWVGGIDGAQEALLNAYIQRWIGSQ